MSDVAPTTAQRQSQIEWILRPLVIWLLRTGWGHGDTAQLLKKIFYECAHEELQRLGQKPTDSALSLLSGLHRINLREYRQQKERGSSPAPSSGAMSTANQIVTRWLAERWPDTLPLQAPQPRKRSFERLARQVSVDVHPRAVLEELKRLGLVTEADGRVTLLRQAFVPDPNSDEAIQLMAESLHDHFSAAVHNVTAPDQRRFLEQSVFADGLQPESVEVLAQLANRLWLEVFEKVIATAQPLVEADEAQGGQQRMRLGIYFYSDKDPS